MSRWLIVFLALMAFAAIVFCFGGDVSPFLAASMIALGFADEEHEYENSASNDDDDWGY